MAPAPDPKRPQEGRKAAYFARNRAAIIRAGQEVLATQGPSATVEEIAAQAGMSVSTLYKHFETKELLFATAVVSAMGEWETWVDEMTAEVADPLEQLVVPMRLFVRGGVTHPIFGGMVANSPAEAMVALPLSTRNLADHIGQLVAGGVLKIDHVEQRIGNLVAVLMHTLQVAVRDPTVSPADSDTALEVALPMIGISPAKAHRLVNLPLPVDASRAIV